MGAIRAITRNSTPSRMAAPIALHAITPHPSTCLPRPPAGIMRSRWSRIVRSSIREAYPAPARLYASSGDRMTPFEPLRAFWSAWGALNPICDPTPWGLVVGDPRFPAVWESNHAAVFSELRTITPDDIRRPLLPILRRAGALYEHVEFWDPPARCRALRAMKAEADHSGIDSVMVFEGDPSHLPESRGPAVRVRHLRNPGAGFWRVYTTSRSEFGGSMDDAT